MEYLTPAELELRGCREALKAADEIIKRQSKKLSEIRGALLEDKSIEKFENGYAEEIKRIIKERDEHLEMILKDHEKSISDKYGVSPSGNPQN